MTDLQINELYFLQRLDPFRIRHSRGNEYRSRCPFHGGNNQTALSVNFETGQYFCFACQAKGTGIILFEQAMSKVETGSTLPFVDAQETVSRIIGTPFEKRVHIDPVVGKKSGWNRKQARDRYMYTDEVGNELYSVWRFVDRDGNKITPPDHPCECSPDSECDKCEDGRVWGSKGVRRVLYRLPDVIQSVLVFVVEGEKNANDLSRAMGLHLAKVKGMSLGSIAVDRVGVTTNPGGAMAWKSEYGFGRYFLGKVVIKLGDNDEQGKKHDEDVCSDVCKYAIKTFTLPLPVGKGEDISDFLETHTAQDLINLFPKMKEWKKPEEKHVLVKDDLAPRVLLIPPSQLIKEVKDDGGDWLVDRLIPRHGRGLVVASPKTGKAQPLTTKVLTPDGWMKMGDLKSGTLVIGSNGKPTEVLAVHPQGVIPTYRVTMCDGSSVECCGEHLWTVQSHDDRRRGIWNTKNTLKIAEELAAGAKRKHYMPMVQPVEFSEKQFVIRPYTMGALLGDGTFRLQNTIGFASADTDIVERVGQECDGFSACGLNQWYIKMKFAKRKLTALGLWGKYAYEKHIPEEYLRGSVSQRMDLLKGLMDTDGSIGKDLKTMEFCTTSSHLAKDYIELIQSLGGTARMVTKYPFYRNPDGEKIYCRMAYRIYPKLPRELGAPFFCERKKSIWDRSTIGIKKNPCRSIVSVEWAGNQDSQCITVDTEDHLYVTEQYILTHNTIFFLDIAIALGTQSSVLGIKPFHRPVRVGIVSREDGPAMVSNRLKALAKGRGMPWGLVDKNIRVNTVEQSQRFRIDVDADLEEMAGWLKAEGIEFTVVDVLNKLHGGEENSSNEMTKIMGRFDDLAKLSGSDVCVIHHTNKTGSARGSSSIEGWADYIFRLESDPTDEALKTLYVRTKASGNPAPKQMYYKQSDDMTESWITMVTPKV